MEYTYLFGPVPSRRFGRSLGIDLVPFKTCSFDCAFCEVGRTTFSTGERAEYVPIDDVVAEFQQWVASGGEAEVITLAGSGEPTLHSRFGELIDAIRSSCDTPIVLLTNSSLMHLPDVRTSAAKADIVKVSLSAWDEASFQRVNRPASGLAFDALVSGLQQFRSVFSGRLWLEVFLLKGINDAPAGVARIAALAEGIAPDSVQLNTVVRPPAEPSAVSISREELECLAPLFSPPAEIIARFQAAEGQAPASSVRASHVLAMLTRRPCTLEDIAGAFGLEKALAESLVETLASEQSIRAITRPDGVYYGPSEGV
ncbi:MAG: radical SAM protein [Verrucomicrobia bacterium]|jgi:wyosine [tRNA(Phe)-imidazoG37] synthetase (radical SAM superfamily)|nr:radical SAM protein [Verrucomicrobiota bacterium]